MGLEKVMRSAKGVRFSTEREDLLVFGRDASQLAGKALAVAWPESEEEVAELVAAASAEEIGLVARGAGTGLAGGAVPDENIVVDLSRMNRVRRIDAAGWACSVEAGVVLNDLNCGLAGKGLFFPVVPSSHKACTIGGMIATNAAGMRSVKYGKTEAWVKSLCAVDGEGNRVKVGGGAGDFCGSEGTLGIITSAELRLAPALGETSIDFLKFEEAGKAVEAADGLVKEGGLAALELIDKFTSEMLGFGKNILLIAEYEDAKRGGERDAKAIARIWEVRDSAYPKLASAEYPIIEDPKVPAAKMGEFLLWLEGNKIPSFGHLALGILHPCFRFGEEKVADEMYSFVEMLGGEVSGEHGIGVRKKKFVSAEFAAKVGKLKKEHDPKGIMNPGKLVGETKAIEKLGELGFPEKCSNCGMCRFNCPTLLAEMNESNSSRGRAVLIKNRLASQIMLKCTLCRHCNLVCPAGVKLAEAIEKAREKVRSEYGEEMVGNIREFRNVYGKPGTRIKALQCC